MNRQYTIRIDEEDLNDQNVTLDDGRAVHIYLGCVIRYFIIEAPDKKTAIDAANKTCALHELVYGVVDVS